MSVWLRRQEMEVYRTLTQVQAVVAFGRPDGSVRETMQAFTKFQEAAFPFLAKVKKEQDDIQKKILEKETKRGPIAFSIGSNTPIKDAVQRERMAQRKLVRQFTKKKA